MRGATSSGCVSAGGGGKARADVARRFRSAHFPLTRVACCATLSAARPIESVQFSPVVLPASTWSPRMCRDRSVMRRYFSCVSTTCADTTASLRTRVSFASFLSTSARSAGVISTFLPVSSSRMSVEDLPLIGGRDLQLFAVLGDGAPREHEPLALQDADDLRVAQRLARILRLDDLANPLLDRYRRDALAIGTADPAVEEVLHLEHALRRVHVLVRHDAADGRFVHADIVGNVAEHQWTEVLDAVIEEVLLEIDDAGGDLVNGLLTLLDGLDQPERRAELVLHISAGLVAVLGVLVEEAPIHRADAHLRQPVLVEQRDVLILQLDDVHVGDDVLGLGRVEAAARFGIEVADHLDVLLQVLDRNPELARDFRHLMVLQQPQVVANDFFGRRAFEAEVADLQQQALLEVARGHADRVEALDQREGPLHIRGLPRAHA